MLSRKDREPANARPRLRVGFILARHFTLTAFANFVDTLRLAADEGDGSRQRLCQWTVMAAGSDPVPSSSGIAVTPDGGWRDPAHFNYIVVAGGLLHRGDQIDAETAAYLHRAATAGTPLIGICTGSFILKRLGLLNGRKVCVSWYHRNDYLEEFGEAPVADRLYLMEDDRITCSGGAGVLDLAAALVEKHVGVHAARKSLNVLLLDSARGADSAQPMPHVAPSAVDTRVRRAVLAMEQALAEPLSVPALAQRAGVSQRQLDRLFRAELCASPGTVYRRMRLDYAHWLLSTSSRSVSQIAQLAGFADAAHFARAYRRQFGAAPGAQRGQFAKAMGEESALSDVPADRRLFAPPAMAK